MDIEPLSLADCIKACENYDENICYGQVLASLIFYDQKQKELNAIKGELSV